MDKTTKNLSVAGEYPSMKEMRADGFQTRDIANLLAQEIIL
ncbi:MAG: hypothetical protein WCI45_08470 [Desulfuromonadales bacterium]